MYVYVYSCISTHTHTHTHLKYSMVYTVQCTLYTICGSFFPRSVATDAKTTNCWLHIQAEVTRPLRVSACNISDTGGDEPRAPLG